MKDEIKEILDKITDEDWYEEKDLTGTKWIELKQEETNLLYDYITNLQTIEQQYSAILSENAELENKITNLEERCEYLQRSCERKEDEILSLRDECVDGETYKSRIDKVIEHIEEKVGAEIHDMMYVIDVSDLLDILKGEDNE